jgi:ElaB/YqjD/DUF883 family membrane-anchored ribosome-binding protein
MKLINKLLSSLLLLISPTLQYASTQTIDAKFKQTLLAHVQQTIKDLTPSEINEIINTVAKNIDTHIETYETNNQKLRSKAETFLAAHKDEVSEQRLAQLQKYSNKPREQLLLEELNPKLKLLSANDYYHDKQTHEIEFTMSKDKLFYPKDKLSTLVTKWDYLAVGDILINFDNGSSGKNFGHAALLWAKSTSVRNARTIEAPGPGDHVRIMNYERWHKDTQSRITYNYVPTIYKTNIPAKAALSATQYVDRPYGIWPVLGTGPTIYCTELVFLAYLGRNVSLGNGMKFGDFGILFPRSLYCEPKLMYYYRQNVGPGMCK